MEHSLVAWLAPGSIILLAGIIIGFFLARLLPGVTGNGTQRQLRELQARFDTYQSEVVTNFNTTANLVKKLTKSYQDIQQHLSESAERLAPDELIRQRLLATLQARSDVPDARRSLTTAVATTEAPKDYASKIYAEKNGSAAKNPNALPID